MIRDTLKDFIELNLGSNLKLDGLGDMYTHRISILEWSQ